MLTVKDNHLTFRLSKYSFPDEIQIFCFDLNIRKKKWLIFYCFNPHKYLLKHHFFQIESAINFYTKTYENLIIVGVLMRGFLTLTS